MSLTQAQLKERKRGIFGSEAAVIEGCHFSMDERRLWAIKTGRHDDRLPDKMILRAGHECEQWVAKEYMKRTGCKLRRNNRTVWDKKHLYNGRAIMGGHIDRKIEGERKLMDCKVTFASGKWGKDGTCEIPPYYITQLKHYCSVFGYNRADLAVIHLRMPPELHIHEFYFTDEELAKYRSKVFKFWDLVESDTPPPVSKASGSREVLRAMSPLAETGRMAVANTVILKSASEHTRYKNAMQRLKDDQALYKHQIMEHMEEAEVLLNPDGSEIATYKNNAKGVRTLLIK